MSLKELQQIEKERDSIRLKEMLQRWRNFIKKLRGAFRREVEAHYLVVVRKVVNWNIVIK